MTLRMRSIDPWAVQGILSAHLPLYRTKVPYYQAAMLDSLRQLWVGQPKRLLDVGGGTGVIAQAISELFPVGEVEAVDLVDRFCPTLSVLTKRYDGKTLPFENATFNAATLNNVMHHVPADVRADLLREIRRVVDGPLYIKDHVTRGQVDNLRLAIMDAIGNIPFGGMVQARYLTLSEWESLAEDSGYVIAERLNSMPYRQGFYARLFPNRLETTMRFEPA